MVRSGALALIATMLLAILLLPVLWPTFTRVSALDVVTNVTYVPRGYLEKVATQCLNGMDLRNKDRFDFEVCVFRKLPALRELNVYFWSGKMYADFILPDIAFGLRSVDGETFYYSHDGSVYPAKWFPWTLGIPVYRVGSEIGKTGQIILKFLDYETCSSLLRIHSPFRIDAYENNQVMLWFKRGDGFMKFIFALETADAGCQTALEHWTEIEQLDYEVVDLTHGGIIVVKDN